MAHASDRVLPVLWKLRMHLDESIRKFLLPGITLCLALVNGSTSQAQESLTGQWAVSYTAGDGLHASLLFLGTDQSSPEERLTALAKVEKTYRSRSGWDLA